MFSRALPSHGGMLTWGRAEPIAVGSGVGVGVAEASRLSLAPIESLVSADESGESEASAEQTASVSPPTKMHGLSSTSIASTS